MGEAKHIRRKLTDAERARVAEARRLVAGEGAEIRKRAREYERAFDAGRTNRTEAKAAAEEAS